MCCEPRQVLATNRVFYVFCVGGFAARLVILLFLIARKWISLKGFLLGFGFDSIPVGFRHGMMIPAFVITYDQFGRDHRSPVELQTVRNHTRSRVLRRGSLLDRPDSIAGRKP
jgi:hypothetical protein